MRPGIRPSHRTGRPVRPRPTPSTRRVPRIGRRSLWLFAACVVVAGLSFGSWRLYHSSIFTIKSSDVRVMGATAGHEDAIREAAAIAGRRFFELDAAAATARISALSWVASASVQRRFPHSATITVRERTPAGIWRIGAVEYVVSDDGTVLDAADGASTLPIIDASQSDLTIQVGDHMDPDPVRVAAHAVSFLPPALARTITNFQYDRQNGLTIVTTGGALIRLGDGKDIDYKLAVWQAIMQKADPKEVHELDLRYGDRPFYH